jgi:hypothetical protein
MCEPEIVAKTGLSVTEHQHRTVKNYLVLKRLAPDLPFVPVIQGWSLSDYRRCVSLYHQAGVNLQTERLIGVGSVCRRQASKEIEQIVVGLAAKGLRLHGFGVKTAGLRRYGPHLTSADSMAWSFAGRHIAGCKHRLRKNGGYLVSEANCSDFALDWRRGVVASARSS